VRHDVLGLGSFRTEVLTSIGDVIADRGVPMVKTSLVIEALERRTGMGPGVIEDQMLAMALGWRSHVPLLHGKGNLGTQDDPPANPIYTEVRLSEAGTVAFAAEAEQGIQLPIGLIEGSLTRGGRRPAYAPRGVLAAVRRVVVEPSVDDGELAALVGAPSFPPGCLVEVDEVASAAGEEVDLVLTAEVLIEYGGPETVVTLFRDRMPPGEGLYDVVSRVLEGHRSGGWTGPDRRERARAARDLHLRDAHEGPGHSYRFVYDEGEDVSLLLDVFHHTEGVQQRHFKTVLPAPLADLVRLAADQPAEPLLAALDAFEAALGR
jgi:hypothetical protein